MKQRAHAWIALRALKLLNDSGKAPRLSELLHYYVSDVWDGAWLPDTLIVDMSYGHTFKMDHDPQRLGFDISQDKWLKIPYSKLKKKLKGQRLCLQYIKDAQILKVPYRTHPNNGGHLPNRVIAISHTIGDMLKMSDYPLIFYARKKKRSTFEKDLVTQKVKDLSLSPMFSARQIALMFFIISHYVADVHMPLHCDYRDFGSESDRTQMGRLPKKLHPSIEEKWELYFPPKEILVLHDHLRLSIDEVVSSLPAGSAIKIDTGNEYALDPGILKTAGDEWKEMVYIARTSYALSTTWIDQPYQDVNDMVSSGNRLIEFEDVTNRIFHDAVESVARIWLKAWQRFIY